MNNKKNQYLEMFLSIADELLENQYIKSRRDFSSRYTFNDDCCKSQYN